MSALMNLICGPVASANHAVLNHLAGAYSCSLDLADLGLTLTGRIELDCDAPVVWIAPPAEPERLFGAYALVLDRHSRVPQRYGSAYYRRCHVRWRLTDHAYTPEDRS